MAGVGDALATEMAAVPPAHPAATILIVEDEPSLRGLYEKILTIEGYGVIAAQDGIEALRWVERQRVHLVILDLMMPRLDGRAVMRGLQANPATQQVPVILITGHFASDLDPNAFTRVLNKPVSIDTLVQTVRACLEDAAPGYA